MLGENTANETEEDKVMSDKSIATEETAIDEAGEYQIMLGSDVEARKTGASEMREDSITSDKNMMAIKTVTDREGSSRL